MLELTEATPEAIDAYEPPAIPTGACRAHAQVMSLPPVPVSYETGTRLWRLLADYQLDIDGVELTVRAGFGFDLSSVPRAAWWLVAPFELSVVAPLFHDWLYETMGRPPAGDADPWRSYTRAEADRIFLRLMALEGVEKWRRLAAYTAVRAAGGLYWD